MKFRQAVNLYVEDQWDRGRFTSKRTEVSYRASLRVLGEQVQERDPRTINREDVKAALRRWRGNTKARNRSMMVSFFDWMVEEGHRKDNPARATPRPKIRKPEVYRLTAEETQRFLLSARGYREQVVAFVGVCAGLRREEIRLLQGRHFARDGWLWVSADIAKGSHERWIPVFPELEPVVAQIKERCLLDHYVLPGQQFSDPGRNRLPADNPLQPSSGQTIWRITQVIGKRAGIPTRVTPHMLRHAFADHAARHMGVQEAQAMLGHADISTTQTYLGGVSLDRLQNAVKDISFGVSSPPDENGPETQEWRRWESNPRLGTTGLQRASEAVLYVIDLARERGSEIAETLR